MRDCEVDNVVTQHMLKAARDAKITDSRLQYGREDEVLCLWCDDVKDHLQTRIMGSMEVKPELNSIATGTL